MKHAILNRISQLFLIGFSCTYLALALQIPSSQLTLTTALSASSVPIFVGSLACVFSGWLLWSNGPQTDQANLHTLSWLRFFAFIVLMLLFTLSFTYLGFVISSSLFLFLGFTLLHPSSYWSHLLIAIAITASFWMLVSYALGLHLAPWPVFLS